MTTGIGQPEKNLRRAAQQALDLLEATYLNIDAKRIYTKEEPQQIYDAIKDLRVALSDKTIRPDTTVDIKQSEHIKELYSVDEIQRQIESNDYCAELLLQHAIQHLLNLEPVTDSHELLEEACADAMYKIIYYFEHTTAYSDINVTYLRKILDAFAEQVRRCKALDSFSNAYQTEVCKYPECVSTNGCKMQCPAYPRVEIPKDIHHSVAGGEK